jgi:hypothetical protein
MTGIFDGCSTIVETIIVLARLEGVACAEQTIAEVSTLVTRQEMRRDAKELARVGMPELSELFARYAKVARRGQRHAPVRPGFQTRSARFVLARRKAKRAKAH